MVMVCSNCGKTATNLCAKCWRCDDCCDCISKLKTKRKINGVIGKKEKID